MNNEAQNENTEAQKENTDKNLISLDNCDFSNKSNVLNSPRSIEACLRLGIERAELYQLSMDEFKKKYPEVKNLSDELIKLRYDAEEKFRNDTIKQAQEERNKIISENEKNKKNENKENNNNDEQPQNKDDDITKWEKLIENEKKGIEKIKKRQRQNIESLIEEQINKELIIKVNEVKDQIKKEKEEEAKKNSSKSANKKHSKRRKKTKPKRKNKKRK